MKRNVIVVLAASLGGCPSVYPRHDPVIPPPAPTPIEGLNTEWDDYHASKPPGLDEIIFSTNRGSKGHDLDVYRATLNWSASPKAQAEPTPYAAALMSPTTPSGSGPTADRSCPRRVPLGSCTTGPWISRASPQWTA